LVCCLLSFVLQGERVGEGGLVPAAAAMRRGSSENNLDWDQPDGPCSSSAGGPEMARSRSCLDGLQQKILMVTEQLKIEQTARDDNVAEYVKLMDSADKQQVARIKQVFEKKNQKSAQSIAQMQKKLEQYHRKMKDSEMLVPSGPASSFPTSHSSSSSSTATTAAPHSHPFSGKHSTIPRESPKQLLRDVTGSGRHPTMDKVKTIGPGVSLSPPFFFSKPREFANLIRNKFGSADNISHLKNSMDTAAASSSPSFPNGHVGTDKGLSSSTSMVAKAKYPSDDDCSSGSASVSADSNGNLLGAGGGAGQTQESAGGPGRLAAALEEVKEFREAESQLSEDMEKLKGQFKRDYGVINQALQEERYRYAYSKLMECIHDTIPYCMCLLSLDPWSTGPHCVSLRVPQAKGLQFWSSQLQ